MIKTIQIYDISGRTVYYDKTGFSGKRSIQTIDINDGIYFIKLTGDKNDYMKKVIVHK